MSACERPDKNGAAHCMNLIPSQRVVEAVKSYYDGGRLTRPITKTFIPATVKPVLKIVTKGAAYGGAERSIVQIARLFDYEGYRVQLCTPGRPHPAILNDLPHSVSWTQRVTGECDTLLCYPSDLVFELDKEQYRCFENVQAQRKVMALTYKLGKVGRVEWTKGWNAYLFLSTALETAFLDRMRGTGLIDTHVLAPPVDLAPFLGIRRDKEISGRPLRIVRHSSQGDKKYDGSLEMIMRQCQNVEFEFMPGPSWLKTGSRITSHPEATTPQGVAQFLARGDCFWYLLPDGYTDQGPRVIVEAMAAGLPVIAENRDGAADRVRDDCGWRLDQRADAVTIINTLTPQILKQKGQAARQRAIDAFSPRKWFAAISGAGP